MSSPRMVEPLEALRLIGARRGPRRARTFPTEEAPPGYLAEAVRSVPGGAADLAAPDGEPPRAARNGYVLPDGLAAGAEFRVLGTLHPGPALDPDGAPLPPGGGPEAPPAATARDGESAARPGAGEALPGAWRVETGAVLPPGADRVLAMSDSRLVGSRRVRVLRLPAAGEGVTGAGFGSGRPAAGRRSRSRRTAAEIPAGTPLDARLRAFLLARGATEVRLIPPLTVGFFAVGDELVDLGTGRETGTCHEITAFWLGEAVARLGQNALPFGILPDAPARIRSGLLHALSRRVDVCIFAGGLGDGITDRTAEALRRFGADIVLSGLAAAGCGGFLQARAEGMEIVALSGRPLFAAAAFDLFVRPLLLSRQGAAPSLWDWSRFTWPLDPRSPPPGGAVDGCAWSIWPAALAPQAGGGGASVRAWPPESEFSPTAAGQEGWAVIGDPAGAIAADGAKPVRRAYFQKLV